MRLVTQKLMSILGLSLKTEKRGVSVSIWECY